jgi:hypothetical protein
MTGLVCHNVFPTFDGHAVAWYFLFPTINEEKDQPTKKRKVDSKHRTDSA